jgi:hypothetical protein
LCASNGSQNIFSFSKHAFIIFPFFFLSLFFSLSLSLFTARTSNFLFGRSCSRSQNLFLDDTSSNLSFSFSLFVLRVCSQSVQFESQFSPSLVRNRRNQQIKRNKKQSFFLGRCRNIFSHTFLRSDENTFNIILDELKRGHKFVSRAIDVAFAFALF